MSRFIFIFMFLSICFCAPLVSLDSPVGEILEELNLDEVDPFKDTPRNDPEFVPLKDQEFFDTPQEQVKEDGLKGSHKQEKQSLFHRFLKMIAEIFKS